VINDRAKETIFLSIILLHAFFLLIIVSQSIIEIPKIQCISTMLVTGVNIFVYMLEHKGYPKLSLV
jgi:hypothetical protein